MSTLPQAGYNVENIILMESNFHRIPNIDFSKTTFIYDLNITPEIQQTTPERKFVVTVTLDFKARLEGNVMFASIIKMCGVFQTIGEPNVSEDSFKKINAPAIIYPFIREHLHTICLKAGMTNVFLPTVNFAP